MERGAGKSVHTGAAWEAGWCALVHLDHSLLFCQLFLKTFNPAIATIVSVKMRAYTVFSAK